ncbi:lipopolysaccharide biosynthesis protein [Bacteroides sp. 519]|uniref:lipopolysaccharide biosynthesis protein n=1 Tax=Bacteroides sp. 519 TaxID=2302937 RepID=UPI0013D7C84C|nr:lipopolysaccharide biosynthesis protein [Bacteroides sp. 519]NDV57783.1 lipopolysaccharide biosynthesis protein [Bacteroides sp. 519]
MHSRNKTIAKNTLILYLRMIIVTIISLYTSRVTLNVLGVDDFGIWNIAGGLIAFFAIINTALSSSVQRFLNIELGKNNIDAFSNTFNVGIEIHFIIGLIILILGETIGLYIFNHFLNIPTERYIASQYVFQFSLFSTIIDIIRTPYNALIIAKERMDFYAYLSIFEVVFKLLIIFFLIFVSYDSLILYSLLYFFISLIGFFFMYIYSKRKLQSPAFKYVSLKGDISKNMITFSSWTLLGNVSNIASSQGMNMWLNIFYGVTLNATMGITNQVTNTISSFISNFQMAYKPAIIQYYMCPQKDKFIELVCRSSKYSFFLLLVICLPLLFNIEYILKIWLGTVPDYTGDFIRILLISLIVSSIYIPLYNAIEASGHIGKYQMCVSIVKLVTIILSYWILKLGFPPPCIMWLHVISAVLFLVVLLYIVHVKIFIRIKILFLLIIYPILKTLTVTLVLSYFFSIDNSLQNIIITLIIGLFSIVTFGLSKKERIYFTTLLKKHQR